MNKIKDINDWILRLSGFKLENNLRDLVSLVDKGISFFLTDPIKKNANKSLMYYFRCDIFVHNTSGNGLFGFTIQLLMKSYKNCSEKCSTVSSTYFFSAQNYSTYFCGRKKHTNDKKKIENQYMY